jgi:hypothetical protein
MRRLITIVALTGLIAAPVFAETETDAGIPQELWDALATVLPQRWTAELRSLREDGALFAGPLTKESERISVQRLYRCDTKRIRWACAAQEEEIHLDANGMRHRIQAPKLDRELVLKIADYMYSPCFEAQREQLGKKGRAPWGHYKRPIYFIAPIEKRVFSVGAGGGYSGVTFRIEAATLNTADSCGFRLLGVGGWIVMRPNSSPSGREEA